MNFTESEDLFFALANFIPFLVETILKNDFCQGRWA